MRPLSPSGGTARGTWQLCVRQEARAFPPAALAGSSSALVAKRHAAYAGVITGLTPCQISMAGGPPPMKMTRRPATAVAPSASMRPQSQVYRTLF